MLYPVVVYAYVCLYKHVCMRVCVAGYTESRVEKFARSKFYVYVRVDTASDLHFNVIRYLPYCPRRRRARFEEGIRRSFRVSLCVCVCELRVRKQASPLFGLCDYLRFTCIAEITSQRRWVLRHCATTG